jgi:hypothetical protein
MVTKSRIRLPKGEQKKFIDTAIARSGNAVAIAALLEISSRTVRDWRREKFLMSYEALQTISARYGISMPTNITIEDEFWYTTKGAHAGGLASYRKQGGVIGGDPVIRKQRWLEWYEREGRFNSNFGDNPLPFNKPEKSVVFAEFIGIMMGDGGMTSSQLTISLHNIDDLEYSEFVIKTMQELFNITPSVYHRVESSVNIIVISRSGLVKYLHELGLPIGNKVKQNFDIPDWIKENHDYMIACIRGLVDTDGCIFTHRYRVNGKQYMYKKMAFSSSSPPLIVTVQNFLKENGFHARVSRQGVNVRIESAADIKRYFELIGSHNPKHLKRYLN